MAFVILPDSGDVIIIGLKRLRESLVLDIVQAFHQRVPEVGELFASPDSAARADETLSSLRGVWARVELVRNAAGSDGGRLAGLAG